MRSDRTRQAEQLQRPVQRQFVDVLRDRGTLGLLALAKLDVGAKPPDPARDFLAGFGILAQRLIVRLFPAAAGLRELAGELALGVIRAGDKRTVASATQGQAPFPALGTLARIGTIFPGREQIVRKELVKRLGHFGGFLLHDLVGLRLEIAPEGFEQLFPCLTATRNIVELIFHPGGEVIGNVTLEKALKERGEQSPGFFCKETVFLGPHIGTVLEHLDRRGICRWTPDAQFLQPLDEARLGKARWRLGEVLLGRNALLGRHVTGLQERQQATFIIVGLVVLPFLINGEKAGKLHDLPRGAQFIAASAIAQGNSGAFKLGRCHLAGHRALENQIVKPCCIARAVTVLRKVSRTDRLVGFLRVLGLGFVVARLFRQEMPVKALGHRAAAFRDRARVHLHAVCTHVGDRTGLIEPLRHAHRLAGGEPELAGGFLLQRRGGERRLRVAAVRFGLDILDLESAAFNGRLGAHRHAFIAQAEAIDLLTLERHQSGGKVRAIMRHKRCDRPVFLRLERLDLTFAINDQAQRNRLHAPC